MGDLRIKDVSALLANFFNEEKLGRGEQVTSLFGAWSSIVGSRLAAHSRIVDIDKGILIVEAEHPVWIQLLQFRQSSIYEDFANRYPKFGLRGIAFRLSAQKGDSLANTAQARAFQEPTSPEAPLENDASFSTLNDIHDPEFRAILNKLKVTLQGKA